MIFALAGFILLLVVMAQLLHRRGSQSAAFSRKILHIGAISVSAASVYLVPDRDALLLITGLAIPVLGILVWKGFFRDPIRGRRSWGIFYFAVVFGLLLWFFRESRPELIFYPMLVLALADGLAALIGEWAGKGSYNLSGDARTVVGSAVFFVSAFGCLWLGHFAFAEIGQRPFSGFPMTLLVAGFLTLLESTSRKGRDNIWIPLFLVYWMFLSPKIKLGELEILACLMLPALASWMALRMGWLRADGAVAALLLGWLMLVSPSPQWVIPALVFFVIGSILSKLPPRSGPSSSRNAIQVLANGGVPVFFLCVYFQTGITAFLVGSVSGFGAALSDTASSEIGSRLRHHTYDIVRWRAVPSGLSGGISWSGTLTGLGFAVVMAFVVVAIQGVWNTGLFAVVIVAGFAGNLIDSMLGSLVQAKYLGPDLGKWSDDPVNQNDEPQRGVKWITNDVVNLLAVFFACLLGFLIYKAL